MKICLHACVLVNPVLKIVSTLLDGFKIVNHVIL